MFAQLSERLDPWRLADRRAVIDGSLGIRNLPRLRDLVLSGAGDVRYEIRFEPDEQGRPLIRGALAADLVLECQRCLQPLILRITAELALVAVKGLDEARLLPEQYDPVVVEDGLVRPLDLIEEELLLALPQIPKHAEHECGVLIPGNASDAEPFASPSGGGGKKPFAVLAGLKDRTKH